MNSYDPPATGDTAYKVVVTASDVPGSSATNSASPALFNYNELLALCLNTTIVDFGILDPGQTSGAESVVGSNVGNLTLDVALSGTSLTYQTNAIAVSQIDYSLSSTFTSPRALSSSSQTVSNYDLIAGATSSKPIYFRLRVPTADQQYLPAGTYQGTISILATQSM